MMLTERRQGVENPAQKLDSSDDEFKVQRMVRKVCTSPKPSRLIFEDENDDEDERCARRKSRLLEPHPTTAHSPRPNETSNRRRSDAAAPRGISQTQIGEHYGNCIRLAAENKITAKNAFNLHLIDYMSDMLKNEDYASFQIASSSLDAGAKIYAGRVDAVHQETYQVLTGLGRSDKAPIENAEDDTDGEPSTQHPAKPGQPRKTQPQRDIIQKQLSKIRSKALTSKADVDPLFQHQTSAYDDGGTAELRLNQLRSLDETCTLILDSSTPVIQAVQRTSAESVDVLGLANTIQLLLPGMANQLVMCPSLRNFRFTDWDLSNESTTLLSLPPSPATPAGGDPLPNDADDHFSDNAMDDDTLVAAPPDEVDQIIPCGSDADAALRNGNDMIERIPSPSEPARQDTDVYPYALKSPESLGQYPYKAHRIFSKSVSCGVTSVSITSSLLYFDSLADSELFVSSLKSMLGKQYEHFGQLNDHILGMWAGPEHWRKKTKRRRFDPITGLEADADAQNENAETDVVLVGKDRKASRTKKPKIAKVIYDPARLPSENRTRNGSLARNTWPKGVLSEGVPNSAAANATVCKEQYRQKASKQMNLLPSQWTDVRQTLYQLYNREVILEPTHHPESNLPPNVKGIEPGDMGVAHPNSEFCAILDHPDGPHTIALDAMDDNHLDGEPPDSPICVGDDDDDDMGLPFQGVFTQFPYREVVIHMTTEITPLSVSFARQFTNAQGEFTTLGGLDLVSQPRKVARIEIDYARTAKMINVRRLKLAMWNFLEHTLPHPLNGARSPMSVASTSSAPDGASLTPSLSGETAAAPEVPGPLASESITSPQMEGHPDVRVPGAVSFRTLIGSLSSRISWQMAKELSIPIAFNCLLHLSNEKILRRQRAALLFNFVTDEIMRRTMDSLQNPGVQIVADESPVDLEYADEIALNFEDQSEAQPLLNKLTTIIPSFGMRLAPSKCEMLQNVPSANIPLIIQAESPEIVENFTYLGSCTSSDGSVSDEVSARISKARITFANLHHLWRQKGISLDLKGRVYLATVRAVLLCGCKTWPLRTDDVRRLQVFNHRCLRSVAGFGWRQRVSNEDLYLEPVPGFSDIFVSQGLPEFEIEALKVYQSEHFHYDEIGPDGSAKRHSRSDNVRQKKAKRHRASTLDSWLVDGEPDGMQSPA
ncbi:hypothetical protein T265_12417 [Opisthorchis viverrini]|uniref:Condensin complex subunit 2 n=1 Tax=Opisthorchis viverrini TaxID=6198 RepID=A0A075A343_OPIVI|nr:hypothetical protein T265_12417 [Opisthorchis viverrini]KER34118.1 hypothetical protein T265_12417 [Opisthorchis viverrini]